MGDTPESLIHDEALRGITWQREAIANLRSRTGTLFTAASLVSAFLGGLALDKQENLASSSWVAIGAFVTLFFLVLAILWPWGFRFVLSPTILIEDHMDKQVHELQLYLARTWRRNYELNLAKVDRLNWLYRGALLALAVEVVAWLLSIAA